MDHSCKYDKVYNHGKILLKSLLRTVKSTYRKIPIISPGLIFVQRAFLLGLFAEGLIIRGNFAFQNGLGLTVKTA